MISERTGRAFFDKKYAQSTDPWKFASGRTELARYAVTLKALGDRRYRRAFEPGCSIGVLTEKLASVCECVEAIDISPIAVSRAQERCKNFPGVTVRAGALPDSVPEGMFDLLMLSEIGYYFFESQLRSLAQALLQQVETGGTVLAVHWLGHSGDHVLSGNRVHEVLRSLDGLKLHAQERHTAFRLDRWERV